MATPLASVALPRKLAPSRNSIVPEAASGVIVAVRTMVSAGSAVGLLEVTTIDDAFSLTCSVTAAELLGPKQPPPT